MVNFFFSFPQHGNIFIQHDILNYFLSINVIKSVYKHKNIKTKVKRPIAILDNIKHLTLIGTVLKTYVLFISHNTTKEILLLFHFY